MRFDGVDVRHLSGGFGADRRSVRERDDAGHMRFMVLRNLVPTRRGFRQRAPQRFRDRTMTGMRAAHPVRQNVLIEHPAYGIGVHRRGVCGLDDGVDDFLGACRLRFRLFRSGHDGDAVAPHDDRQVRKRPLHLPEHLVHRTENRDGVKLCWDGDGSCRGGHGIPSREWMTIVVSAALPHAAPTCYSSSVSPVRTWAWTWKTLCPASRPVLKIRR